MKKTLLLSALSMVCLLMYVVLFSLHPNTDYCMMAESCQYDAGDILKGLSFAFGIGAVLNAFGGAEDV